MKAMRLALLFSIALVGCSHDLYTTQAQAVQLHTQKFTIFLNRELVEAALHENQAIELIGAQMKAGAPSDGTGVGNLERHTALLDTLQEQAARNWFSLAQFFSTHRKFQQARYIYRRIIETYSKGGDRVYATYALTALRDLEILALGSGGEESFKPHPSLSALDTRQP